MLRALFNHYCYGAVWAISAALYAVAGHAFSVDVGVNGTTLHSDNALRVADENAAISERQDTYGMGLLVTHISDKLNFSADYLFAYTAFSEGSQRDRQTKNGRALLLLGRESDIFKLAIENSVQLTLTDPSDEIILQNLGERSITSVRPSINLRVSSVDRVSFVGSYQEIRFAEQAQRDSAREGLSSLWAHSLSQISTLSLAVSHEDVEFEFFPQSSYTVEYVDLRFTKNLRNIEYFISIGRNTSSNDEGKFSAARYGFDFNYSVATSVFGIRASRTLTDSSQGNGNQVLLGEEQDSSNIDATFAEADQIELTEKEVFWSSTYLCARCDSAVSFRVVNEQYIRQTDQNNVQAMISLDFAYRLSMRSSVSIQYAQSEREFPILPLRDFKFDRIALSYRRSFRQNFSFRAFVNRQDRDNINTAMGVIRENQYGLGLDYRF